MITEEHLKLFFQREGIYLCEPGTYEWQGKGMYTAYKNFTDPTGCEMEEDENPLIAIVKLYSKLNKQGAV